MSPKCLPYVPNASRLFEGLLSIPDMRVIWLFQTMPKFELFTSEIAFCIDFISEAESKAGAAKIMGSRAIIRTWSMREDCNVHNFFWASTAISEDDFDVGKLRSVVYESEWCAYD